jgi:ketosteroid isomerase-like protein
VSASPIERLLAAFDKLDAERAVAGMAEDCSLLAVDGRRADGRDGVRDLFAAVIAQLHSTSHRLTDQWHVGDVWIAEVEANYVLVDRLELHDVPRVFILHERDGATTDVRIYGAHERKLSEHGSGDGSLHVAGRWMPPL